MAERLIDAEAFEEKLEDLCVNEMKAVFDSPHDIMVARHAISEVRWILEKMPTIEAKPVVHAHWNADGRCTNCGEHAPFLAGMITWHESEYCHGCGAQMDENNTQKVSIAIRDITDEEVEEIKELVKKGIIHKDPVGEEGESGVKIPVVSMEDVPKIAKEMEK